MAKQVRPKPLPTYYPRLRELVTRLTRRPDRILTALRLLELLTAVTALSTRVESTDGLTNDSETSVADDHFNNGFESKESELAGRPARLTARPQEIIGRNRNHRRDSEHGNRGRPPDSRSVLLIAYRQAQMS